MLTQMLPRPLASQLGPLLPVGPTVTVSATVLVAGSIRLTVPSCVCATHTAPSADKDALGEIGLDLPLISTESPGRCGRRSLVTSASPTRRLDPQIHRCRGREAPSRATVSLTSFVAGSILTRRPSSVRTHRAWPSDAIPMGLSTATEASASTEVGSGAEGEATTAKRWARPTDGDSIVGLGLCGGG